VISQRLEACDVRRGFRGSEISGFGHLSDRLDLQTITNQPSPSYHYPANPDSQTQTLITMNTQFPDDTQATIAMDQFPDDTQVPDVESQSLLGDDRYASSEEWTTGDESDDCDPVSESGGSPAPAPPSLPAREPSGYKTITFKTKEEYDRIMAVLAKQEAEEAKKKAEKAKKEAATKYNAKVLTVAFKAADCKIAINDLFKLEAAHPGIKASSNVELLKLVKKSGIFDVVKTNEFEELCEAVSSIRTLRAAKDKNKGAGKTVSPKKKGLTSSKAA
jgi:hypothetical protein